MATGRLGAQDLSAAANTTLYTCPSDTFAVVSVSLCNRSNQACNVRMAISTSATPGNAEWIEYDTELLGKGVLERTGIVMDAGKLLVVYSNAAGVSAVAFGLETSTL
jgi:hypothetical protein